MNLREDKGWSYGAGTFIPGARGQRPFLTYAPVQTDKTKESIVEVSRELRGILEDKPPTEGEVEQAKASRTLTLPGQWETVSDVADSLANLVRFGYGDDYFDTYTERVQRLSLGQISEAAQEVVKPDNLVWVVVGDRDEVLQGVRELDIAEVEFLDADGRLLTD
jgi:zinc protease